MKKNLNFKVSRSHVVMAVLVVFFAVVYYFSGVYKWTLENDVIFTQAGPIVSGTSVVTIGAPQTMKSSGIIKTKRIITEAGELNSGEYGGLKFLANKANSFALNQGDEKFFRDTICEPGEIRVIVSKKVAYTVSDQHYVEPDVIYKNAVTTLEGLSDNTAVTVIIEPTSVKFETVTLHGPDEAMKKHHFAMNKGDVYEFIHYDGSYLSSTSCN